MKFKDDPAQRVSASHYAVAFLALLNASASRKPLLRRLIFALPRPLLKAYLYGFKALEQLR